MPAPTEAEGREAFKDSLRRAAAVGDFASTRLCRLLEKKRCPAHILRDFGSRVHAGALAFPGVLATLIANAPDEPAAGVLLRNLLSEEGVVIVPGQGAKMDPEERHVEWSARLARACGVADPGGIQPADMGAARLEASREPAGWLNAVAYFLVGLESNFAQASAALGAALKGRGLPLEDLVFLTRHAVADQGHGDDALELVAARAITSRQQREALAAAREGAVSLFDQYN